MGLAGALPVSAQEDLTADPTCRKRNTNANVGAFVATAIDDDGALTSDFGSGADYTSTGWALLGLTAFGTGSSAVPTALATLQNNVRSYAYADNEVVPGAVGLCCSWPRRPIAIPRLGASTSFAPSRPAVTTGSGADSSADQCCGRSRC